MNRLAHVFCLTLDIEIYDYNTLIIWILNSNTSMILVVITHIDRNLVISPVGLQSVSNRVECGKTSPWVDVMETAHCSDDDNGAVITLLLYPDLEKAG